MTKKLWGGRFKKKIDKDFFEFQKSIRYDYKLAEYDILHSLIHIGALQKAGILKDKEPMILKDAINKVAEDIKKEIGSSRFKAKKSEDIHTEIQNRVEKKLGKRWSPLALKLHTLRSRNDQIVFDARCYCATKSLYIEKALNSLGINLLSLADNYLGQKFIGYTHTQRAQEIYFTDYLLAFERMFNRDVDRIDRFYENLFVYIGAGALTGSSLSGKNYNDAIKEYLTVVEAKKIKTTDNPLDNISDRDFIIEFLSILSIIQMHLSRLAEDLILYSTKEFNLIELPEEFCTGSSLMPHKKNPDFLELVRGNTGKIYGNLMSILTTMKGLPLAYNRDMQLDKEPLFSSVETAEEELKIMAKFIKLIKLKEANVKAILEKDLSLYATEIAELLVRKEELPFKKAHDIVGKFIILLESRGGEIKKIGDEELRDIHPNLKEIIKVVTKPGYAVSSRKTFSRRNHKIKDIKK